MKGYRSNATHHGDGEVDCWWFRWHDCCEPGKYIVTFDAGPFWPSRNRDAVIDDFGNLVPVGKS